MLLVVVFVLVFSLGCFWEGRGGGDLEADAALDAALDALFEGGAGGSSLSPEEREARAIPLTMQASELRRVREEHQALIESIPPTPEATPTMTPEENQVVVLAKVLEHPDGVPLEAEVVEDWFNPALGLAFYRDSGGDWTPRSLRESHSHRNLFYYEGYPEGVLNFADGSILRGIAQEMVFEAVQALPLLGDPTPAMVDSFVGNIGWEIRPAQGAVVNLWTTFVLSRGAEVHTFAVGGVMRMGVAAVGNGEDRLEHLVIGDFVGPVVVERLG